MVANLKSAGDTSFKVDVNQPYAEMWIGTHPSGPSNLLTNSGRIGPLLKVDLDSFPMTGKRVGTSNMDVKQDGPFRVASMPATCSSRRNGMKFTAPIPTDCVAYLCSKLCSVQYFPAPCFSLVPSGSFEERFERSDAKAILGTLYNSQ